MASYHKACIYLCPFLAAALSATQSEVNSGIAARSTISAVTSPLQALRRRPHRERLCRLKRAFILPTIQAVAPKRPKYSL